MGREARTWREQDERFWPKVAVLDISPWIGMNLSIVGRIHMPSKFVVNTIHRLTTSKDTKLTIADRSHMSAKILVNFILRLAAWKDINISNKRYKPYAYKNSNKPYIQTGDLKIHALVGRVTKDESVVRSHVWTGPSICLESKSRMMNNCLKDQESKAVWTSWPNSIRLWLTFLGIYLIMNELRFFKMLSHS